MPRFDSTGLFAFELPVGLGPNPELSGLTLLRFNHFSRAGEALVVGAEPALGEFGALSDEAWVDRVSSRRPGVKWRLARGQPGRPARADGEDECSPGPGWRRLRVVRGLRLDIVVMHLSGTPLEPGTSSAWIETVTRTLRVPQNTGEPRMAHQEEVQTLLEEAAGAVRRQDWTGAIPKALLAAQLAMRTFATSVHSSPIPEVPAAFTAAQAILLFGQATGDVTAIREAELLAMRCLNTLRELTFMRRTSRDHWGAQIQDFLDAIGRLQGSMYPPLAAILAGRDLVQRAKARSELCFELAKSRIEQKLYAQARAYLESSVLDLCTHRAWLTNFPSNQPLPAAVVAKLKVTSLPPAEQVATFRMVCGRFDDLDLQQRLYLLCSSLERENRYERALEASKELLVLSRSLSTSHHLLGGGPVLPPEGQGLALARSLILNAVAQERLGDDRTLSETWSLLQEAEVLLDAAHEEGALRAWLCLSMVANRHGRRILEGTLQIADRGLRACDSAPEETAKFRRELLTMKSQFLMLEGRLEEAASTAQLVLRFGTEEGELSVGMASYHLNAALVSIRAGQPAGAMESLRQALRCVFESEPLVAVSAHILHVAAELTRRDAPRLATELDSAALLVFENIRDELSEDQLRLIFGEAARLQDLQDKLIAQRAGEQPVEVLATIDRMRGRSLHRLIHPSKPGAGAYADATSDPQADALAEGRSGRENVHLAGVEMPAFDEQDPRDSFAAATRYLNHYVRARRVLHGDPVPLEGEEIEQLAATSSSTILMIHPMGDRTLIALTHGPGHTHLRWSTLGRTELRAMVERSFHAMGIRPGARGSLGPGASKPLAQHFTTSLHELHDALLSPVQDLLDPGRPLCIIPYGEFALIPYHLLRNEHGEYLLERFTLFMAPSAAVWAALRGSATRAWHPASAYVLGDPATPPGLHLMRLEGAMAEAREVAGLLKDKGIAESSVLVRTDDKATDRSFFDEAGRRSLVHLACHGEFGATAEESRLFLAPSQQSDGALLATEIPAVELDGALVFLSACESGQGFPSADGVVGLGRAFLSAGARCTVLSLWRVDDTVTRWIARHFYEELMATEKPVSAAEALRRAMLAARAKLEKNRDTGTGRFDMNPADWGAFFVLGDDIRYEVKP